MARIRKRMTAKTSSLRSGTPLERGLAPAVKVEKQHPTESVREQDPKSIGNAPFVIQVATSEELLRWVALVQSRNQCQENQGSLEVPWRETSAPEDIAISSPVWSYIRAPPLTLEDDVEAYMSTFERVANACHWPREQWVARLVPALYGAPKAAYDHLDPRDKEDYGKVRAAILLCRDNSGETRRQRFRQFSLENAEGPHEAWWRLHKLCHQWLRPNIRSKEQIVELLIVEQFLNILPEDVRAWVLEWCPETCSQALALVEMFTHRQREAKRSDVQVEDVTSDKDEEMTPPVS